MKKYIYNPKYIQEIFLGIVQLPPVIQNILGKGNCYLSSGIRYQIRMKKYNCMHLEDIATVRAEKKIISNMYNASLK